MSDFFIDIQVKYILFVSFCSPIVEVEAGFEQVYYFISISKSYIHVRFVKVQSTLFIMTLFVPSYL